MPAILAHFQYGIEILKNLGGHSLETVKKYPEEYVLGLQGPDLLFFFKPYTGKYISKIGSEIHSKEGRCFFEKCKEVYQQTEDESVLAYILGCVCHYWLDRNEHPFVYERAPSMREHYLLEAEFDLYISKKYNLNYPRSIYIPIKDYNYNSLCKIYGISAKNFKSAVSDFKRYSKILDNRQLVVRLEKILLQRPYFSCMSPPVCLKYNSETQIMYEIWKDTLDECLQKIYYIYDYMTDGNKKLIGFELNFEGK